jgi:hypothetical protein
MSIDPNDVLLGGGIPAAKFPTIGTTVKGTVVSSEVTQQTDFATGKPKTWDDGKPMQQVVITLQTIERDPDVADDDGVRKLYVKGQMTNALRDALRAAGARLEVGGTLAVQYVEDEPSATRGFNPKKIYRAQYVAPTLDQTNDLLGGAPVPAGGVPADDLI